MKAQLCPVCNGSGEYRKIDEKEGEGEICHGCGGMGWIEVSDEPANEYPPYTLRTYPYDRPYPPYDFPGTATPWPWYPYPGTGTPMPPPSIIWC